MQSPASQLAVAVSSADHAQGPADAPLILVEYGDYECPNCVRTFSVVKRLQQELGSRLQFVYRHFPQSGVHPFASIAAEAAEAAGAQGRFWDMHDKLYARIEPLGDVDYDRLAINLGLELYRFRADLASHRFARRVKADYDSGQSSGVTRTPTFFLNGFRLHTTDYDILRQAISTAL